MKKRLLHMFVTALLCSLFLSGTSSAIELITDSTGRFQYFTDYGYVSLYSYLGTDTQLTMPVTLDGEKVEEWYPSEEANNTVTSLTIPKEFDAILMSGTNPFYRWTALTNITAEGVGEYRSEEGVLFNYNMLCCYPAAKTGKSYSVPEGITEMHGYAFSSNPYLEEITIPVSIRSLYSGVFDGCSNLKTIYYEGTRTQWMKLNAYGLNQNVVCKGSSYTSDFEYEYSEELGGLIITDYLGSASSVTIPAYIAGQPVKQLHQTFYNNTTIKSVTISSGVESIGFAAFYGCTSLSSVTIPNTVTEFANDAFGRCTGLTALPTANGLVSMGNYAFSYCTGLTSLSFPTSLEKVGSSAFSNCTGLTSLKLPGTLKTIENSAFMGCSNLKTISFAEGVVSIGSGAFSGCNQVTTLALPASLENAVGAFYNMEGVTSISVASGSKYLSASGNVLFNKDKTELIYYPQSLTASSYTVPSTVKLIADYAFYGNSNLVTVTCNSGVQEIGANAFGYCSNLKNFYLPITLQKVNNWAFSSCYALSYTRYSGTQAQWKANVTVGSGNTYLTNKLSYSTATHVSHPVCGVVCDCDDGSHSTESWSSWNGTSSLGSGNYYLTQNIDRESGYTIYGSVVICLNGHTITTNGQAPGLEVTSTGKLTICDCSGTGGLHSDNGDNGYSTNEIGVANEGTLKIYDGAFHGGYCGIYNTGTVTIYGGEITGQEYGITNHEGGSVRVYGGTVTSNDVSVLNDETFLLDGGTIKGTDFLNYGTLTMNSGLVQGYGPYNDNYDGVTNYGTMVMTGGSIRPNRVGIALNNQGILHFSGGTLSTGILMTNGVRYTITGLWNSSKDSICYLSGNASPGCVHLYYPNTLVLTDQSGTQAYTGNGFRLRIEPYYFTSGTAIYPVTEAQAETIVLYNSSGSPSQESGHLKYENNKLTFTPHTTEYVASVDPTCTKPGLTYGYRCTSCGYYTVEPVEIPVKDHKYITYISNGDATCTVDGTKTASCAYNCGTKETVADVGSKLEHQFTTYTTNGNATCTADGTETASCDRGCGATDTRTADGSKLEHIFTEYTSNEDATCKADGTETASCDHGCGATDTRTVAGSKLTHIFAEYFYNEDATCEVDGTETASCDRGCGETDTRTAAGSKLTHEFSKYVSNGDATCEADGTETATCDHGCGASDTRTAMGSKLSHEFSKYVSNDDATCFADGTETATCDHGCGASDTRTAMGSKLSHEFSKYSSNGDATCTADGTETATCDHGCGASDTHTAIGSKLSHKFSKYVFNGDATCTADGTETASCNYGCGETDTRTAEGSKLNHEFSKYVFNGDATCEADGTETAFCNYGCGETDTRTADSSKLTHEFSKYVSNGDATCFADGTETASCNHGCGATDTRTRSGSKLTHEFSKYVSNGDATCTADGTKTASCSHGCGAVYTCTDKGSKLTHSFTEYVSNDDATCTQDGSKTSSCDYGCGETDTRTDTGSKLAHVFTKYVSDENATCTANGTATAKCEYGCGTADTFIIANSKLDHSFTEYVSNMDATCTADGTKTASCDHGCGAIYTCADKGSKLTHSFVEYISNSDATCTADGTETATCNHGCGATDTRTQVGSKLTHEYSKYVSNSDATCTADGTETATCNHGCGATDTRIQSGSKLTHVFSKYVSNGDATCTADGTETASCDYGCGTTDTRTADDSKLVHSYGEWSYEDSENHKKICTCGAEDRQAHSWDSGVITTQPTESAEGVKTFTCSVCQGTKTEKVDKLPVVEKIGVPDITVTNRASDGKPYISWTAVDGATGYEVYYCGTSKGTYKLLYTAKADKLNVTHTGAVVGNDYFYKVRVIKDDMVGEFSSCKGVWCDLTRPTITVTNRASDGKPTISWTEVKGATGYEVYRCGTSTGTYVKMYTAAANKLSVTHTGAVVGNDYFYKVKALYEGNSKCDSAYSSAKGVWCDLKQPTITVTNRASDGKPTISWKAVEGATGYQVYRADSSDGTYKLLYTAKADKLSVTHTGAVAGNDYFYKVKALYEGNSKCDSAYSAAKGVWCDLARPTLTVTLNSKGKPYLKWTEAKGADAYKVYRSADGGDWSLIYTAAGDDLDVIHTGAKSGVTYEYKVMAVCNASSKANSAYSLVKSITSK